MSRKWETITFDQIKKGDRLKIKNTCEDRKNIYEGVAEIHENGAWMTKTGMVLTWRNSHIVDSVQRRVVKPPKPEPLPTKVGSVILVSEMFGFTVFEPPMPLHLTPSCSWVQIGGHRSYDAGSITKWEHASVLATSTLYK